jgi:hypothetical protein
VKVIKDLLIWLAVNTCMVLLVTAAASGVEGAGNLVRFIVWFMFIVSFLVVLVPPSKERIEEADKPRSVPLWASVPVRLFLIGMIVWIGWWATAAAYLWAWFAAEVSSQACKRLKAEAADKASPSTP